MAKKKRIIFEDTDIRHARLRIQLDRDGLSQAEFFRTYVTAYLERDPNIVEFIVDYKLHNGTGQKRLTPIVAKEERLRNQLVNKFGIKDDELENIFDLIAEEHPDL